MCRPILDLVFGRRGIFCEGKRGLYVSPKAMVTCLADFPAWRSIQQDRRKPALRREPAERRQCGQSERS